MASLAQYSASLQDTPHDRVPAAGASPGSRIFFMLLSVATVVLVLAAALQTA